MPTAEPYANLYPATRKLISSIWPKQTLGVTPLRTAPRDPREFSRGSHTGSAQRHCRLAGQPEATARDVDGEKVRLNAHMLVSVSRVRYLLFSTEILLVLE